MTIDHANEMMKQFLRDAQEREHPHLVDIADLFCDGPTDIEILDALIEVFDLTHKEMIDRLQGLDFNALRLEIAA